MIRGRSGDGESCGAVGSRASAVGLRRSLPWISPALLGGAKIRPLPTFERSTQAGSCQRLRRPPQRYGPSGDSSPLACSSGGVGVRGNVRPRVSTQGNGLGAARAAPRLTRPAGRPLNPFLLLSSFLPSSHPLVRSKRPSLRPDLRSAEQRKSGLPDLRRKCPSRPRPTCDVAAEVTPKGAKRSGAPAPLRGLTERARCYARPAKGQRPSSDTGARGLNLSAHLAPSHPLMLRSAGTARLEARPLLVQAKLLHQRRGVLRDALAGASAPQHEGDWGWHFS